jgi:hypothetical protein
MKHNIYDAKIEFQFMNNIQFHALTEMPEDFGVLGCNAV